MPPITKTSDEAIREAIEKTSKKTADEILEKFGSSSGAGTGGSKISQILRTVNKGQTQTGESEEEKEKLEMDKERKKLHEEREKEKLEFESEKEKLQKELQESEVSCPSCHKGHVHVLKGTANGKVKCTGDNCGIQYSLIPDNSDYKCETCGLPHKKPVESTPTDVCPFCDGDKFKKYDWSKIKKQKK